MRKRLRKPTVSRSVFAFVPLTMGLASYAATSMVGAGVDRSMAIAGTVFAVATYAIAELRQREAPRKRIVYVGQEDTLFAGNIVDGLRQELDDGVPHTLLLHAPDPSVVDPVLWQSQKIEALNARNCDALVVLPVSGDPRIWNPIARLIADGISVVILDSEPPQILFSERGLPPPPFVASDFKAGGSMIGEYISQRLEADQLLTAVIAIGPRSSWAGSARSSSILYEITLAGLGDRVRSVVLTSWDAPKAGEDVARAIAVSLRTADMSVVAFCGDDRIVSEVSRRIDELAHDDSRIGLIGYDGTLNIDGRLSVAAVSGAIATLDTRPGAQGVAAGQVLRGIYDGRGTPPAPSRFVHPRLVFGPSWA